MCMCVYIVYIEHRKTQLRYLQFKLFQNPSLKDADMFSYTWSVITHGLSQKIQHVHRSVFTSCRHDEWGLYNLDVTSIKKNCMTEL